MRHQCVRMRSLSQAGTEANVLGCDQALLWTDQSGWDRG